MRQAIALGPAAPSDAWGGHPRYQDAGATWRNERPVSAAAKLVGFLLLLIAVFLAAHAAGAQLGPVTTSTVTTQPGGSSGSMRMGGQP
jgi:hypothetical protein